MRRGSASFARVRAQAPGFKPGAQRRVHELMNDIPTRIAWTDGTIVATHAGLTRRWGVRRFGHAWTGMTADRIAARLNRLPEHPGSLAALYMDDDGPLWARPGHGDYDGRLTQVSGHTPVPSVRNVEGVWLCDTFSVFCQVGVGRFGVSFSPCERRVSGRFGVGRSCWLLVIALVIA